ncbi:DsbE family thiol:disulfide interchange protein [Pseudohoeflea suaedae]|uniref:DsbE family thiol:disulfide interchange protein n=1 Tax=Pseudohoeflea suaedae TaxID=877384 RepID=A0A4R5PLA8_9HYPH|nr:DsbE family thiol:disulfide interchange protein [Pseudohoeflea suaedae]TDH37716.1 DsbE family thiol:disulfide interchange protein [Pseudohoeflea suaedae]
MSSDHSEPHHDEASSGRSGRSRFIFAFLPLIVFALLAIFFYVQLISGRDANEVPSVLIGTKAPLLDLPPLEGLMHDGSQVPALTDGEIAGKLTLINVFASWCVPCRQEHPYLLELSKDPRIEVVAINYKDKTENALQFLDELGNPYAAVGIDPRGQASIDWGVYGIPETYLVGPDGTILFKQIGPFTEELIAEKLEPLIAEHAVK